MRTIKPTNPVNNNNLFSFSFIFAICLFSATSSFAIEFTGMLKSVTITDSSGANQPPVAAINYTLTGNTFTFNANESIDSDGSIVEYHWDFGDGISDTGISVTHTYTISGEIPVTLSVIDDSGAIALSQVILKELLPCSDTPTISQSNYSSAAQIGNFSNVYFQGTTYRGENQLTTCSIDVSLRQWAGNLAGKNFHVAVFSLDSNNNLSSSSKAVSIPVSAVDIPLTCGMVSFNFESPVTIAPNDAIVVYMDGDPDSHNYAGACYQSYNDFFPNGEFATWNADKTIARIRTDGSDLTFNLYEAK